MFIFIYSISSKKQPKQLNTNGACTESTDLILQGCGRFLTFSEDPLILYF
jgi:hypothetical protein